MSYLCKLSVLYPLLLSLANAQHEYGSKPPQQPLGTDCLLGPIKLDAVPSCLPSTQDEPWAPWTHRPFCIEHTNYCAFTNAHFQGPNRGVSLIDTRPQKTTNASSGLMSITKMLSSMPHTSPEADDESPSYEVRDIPGKGKGLVATRKIARGEAFMVDYAAVVADAQLPSRVRREQGRELLREAIERLPAADVILNLARSSTDPENVPVAEDVMKTNSFSVEIGGRGYMALFPKIARMNHACRPSALTRFNATTLSNHAIAFHDILPDQEITISYSPFGLSSPARHKTLLSKWGFNCTCALCTLPPAQLSASDARRVKISTLGKQVVELISQSDIEREGMKKAAGLYEEAVNAVKEEEGLVPHLGGHYEVLGRLLVAAGEGKRGREVLGLAERERRGWEGGGQGKGEGLGVW